MGGIFVLLHFDVFVPTKCIHSQRPLTSTLFHGFLLLSNDLLSYDIFPKIRYADPRAVIKILAKNLREDKHKLFMPLAGLESLSNTVFDREVNINTVQSLRSVS